MAISEATEGLETRVPHLCVLWLKPLVSWFYLSLLSANHLAKCLPVTECLPVSLSVCFFACPVPKYSIFPFGAVISCLPRIVTPRVCTATPYPPPCYHSRIDCIHQHWRSRYQSPPTRFHLYPLGSNHHHLISLLVHPVHFPYTFICIQMLKYTYRPALTFFFHLCISNIFQVKINKLGNTS